MKLAAHLPNLSEKTYTIISIFIIKGRKGAEVESHIWEGKAIFILHQGQDQGQQGPWPPCNSKPEGVNKSPTCILSLAISASATAFLYWASFSLILISITAWSGARSEEGEVGLLFESLLILSSRSKVSTTNWLSSSPSDDSPGRPSSISSSWGESYHGERRSGGGQKWLINTSVYLWILIKVNESWQSSWSFGALILSNYIIQLKGKQDTLSRLNFTQKLPTWASSSFGGAMAR